MKIIALTETKIGSVIYVVAANIIWLEPHADKVVVHIAGGDSVLVDEPIEAIAAMISTW